MDEMHLILGPQNERLRRGRRLKLWATGLPLGLLGVLYQDSPAPGQPGRGQI